MDINVRVMQEGEVVRQMDKSTLVAEEGQVLLSLTDGKQMAAVLMDPELANQLAIRVTSAAHSGSTMAWLNRRKHGLVSTKGTLGPTPLPQPLPARPGFWTRLFGTHQTQIGGDGSTQVQSGGDIHLGGSK